MTNGAIQLPMGNKCFDAIHDFFTVSEDFFVEKQYTLSFYDQLNYGTLEVIADYKDYEKIIKYVSIVEHDFPEWIGANDLSESFVVGINFTRGNLKTNSVYKWKGEGLVRVDASNL